MKSFISETTFTNSIFTTGILSAFLLCYFPGSNLLKWILLGVILIYLFLGWYLFKAYHPHGHTLLLFIMGYLYSGIFVGSLFAIKKWPLAETVMNVTVIWAIAQLTLVITLKNKLTPKNLIQFLIEATLMLGLSIFQIVRF